MVGIHTTAPTATLTVIGPNASGSGLAAPTVLKVTGGVGGLGNFSMRVGRDGHLYMMAEVEWNPDADHFLPVLEVTK